MQWSCVTPHYMAHRRGPGQWMFSFGALTWYLRSWWQSLLQNRTRTQVGQRELQWHQPGELTFLCLRAVGALSCKALRHATLGCSGRRRGRLSLGCSPTPSRHSAGQGPPQRAHAGQAPHPKADRGLDFPQSSGPCSSAAPAKGWANSPTPCWEDKAIWKSQ